MSDSSYFGFWICDFGFNPKSAIQNPKFSSLLVRRFRLGFLFFVVGARVGGGAGRDGVEVHAEAEAQVRELALHLAEARLAEAADLEQVRVALLDQLPDRVDLGRLQAVVR